MSALRLMDESVNWSFRFLEFTEDRVVRDSLLNHAVHALQYHMQVYFYLYAWQTWT